MSKYTKFSLTIDTVKNWSKWDWHSKIDQNEDWHCQKLIKMTIDTVKNWSKWGLTLSKWLLTMSKIDQNEDWHCQKMIKITIDTVKNWSKWGLTLSKINQKLCPSYFWQWKLW